ncbi:MAG TPA: heme o synthase [Terriglobia bacterium]|nr:heme o synthase [Terriglobia bacterium]
MSAQPNSLAASWIARRTGVADYLELTKPGVTGLILFACAVGFYLASPGGWAVLPLLHTLAGTAMVAGGTAALNQFWEREQDAKMRRTRNRPLPAGRMAPWKALWFGVALALFGTVYLWLLVNRLSAALAALTLLSYLFFYTPLKTRSPHCTLVGSFPGAIPPLIGWAAVEGSLPLAAWTLYGMLFLWQFPHFLSIAWLYREDYERAGIAMLPVVEPDGKSTARQVVLYAGALLPVSLLPTWLGVTGGVYFSGALLLGLGFLYVAARTAMAKTRLEARRLLQASVFYLPLIYGLMLLDKTPR